MTDLEKYPDAGSTLRSLGWIAFVIGTVLAGVWFVFGIFRVAISRASLFGVPSTSAMLPRDLPDLWFTAVLMSAATAFLVYAVRSLRKQDLRWRAGMVLAVLSALVAGLNWLVLAVR
ncbi:hypothetical protein [Agromyces humi]|uniref:hypothetical protein n=1 Tax=Agromyces humi TaxID=1766800 RepID=UPI001359A864|nr:hypothetical protein [Agromyces humi]